MKVLWLRPSKGDNISVRRERIAEVLREKGYSIDIVDASGLDAVRAVWRAVTTDYDVIAGNVRIGLYLGYPLSLLLRKPFLGDVSDPISDIEHLPSPLFRLFKWYEWNVLRRADAVVFVYESSLQQARERGINDAVKLPNGVNYEMFSNPDDDAVADSKDILASSGVTFEKPIGIYLGVLSPDYGIKELLEAADRTPGWEFVFVGEGPMESAVSRAASELENVSYPGAFPYRLMPGFLSHADVGFCFKDAEQPLKLKEYGAAGLPVIAGKGELEKWYDEDELIFVELTPDSISAELINLCRDQSRLEKFSNASQKLGKEVRWSEIADGYDTLFSEISS